MRIGLFSDTYVPQINGVATSVHLLQTTLQEMGHDVYVFTTSDPDVKGVDRDVYRLPSAPVLTERRLAMVYHPRIAREVRRLKLDVIHTHTEFSLGIFGRNLAEDLDIPLVHTYHTIYEDYTHFVAKRASLNRVARSAARTLTRTFCNQANEVIVPTEKVKDLLLTYDVVRDLHVVPTGIDLDRFKTEDGGAAWRQETRRELGLTEDQFVLVSVGRVSEEKNIQEVLAYLGGWLPQHPTARMVIVGDGAYREALEQEAKDYHISKQVIFAGYRPFSDIAKYYALGDVFVSASQSETQGLTYIEALASGRPVLARNDRCLEGVIDQGVNGFVYDHPSEASAYLDRFTKEHDLLPRMGDAARLSMLRYSKEYFAASVLEVYEMAIQEPMKRRSLLNFKTYTSKPYAREREKETSR